MLPYVNVSAFGLCLPPPLPRHWPAVAPIPLRLTPCYDRVGTCLGLAPRHVSPAVDRAVSGYAYTRPANLRRRVHFDVAPLR